MVEKKEIETLQARIVVLEKVREAAHAYYERCLNMNHNDHEISVQRRFLLKEKLFEALKQAGDGDE